MAEPLPSLDTRAVGVWTAPHVHAYGWRELATYALGIGATAAELPFLYEGVAGGMRVVPTYAVVPAYPVVIELCQRVGAAPTALIHSAQRVVAHRSAPPEGVLATTGRIAGLYDLRRFAQLLVETRTELGGAPLFDTSWTIVVRGAGGFGGPRPPRRAPAPAVPDGREPDWSVEQATRPEQALIYRLSGDPNPLHADDQAARAAGFARGAILHGLCTLGFVARALLAQPALAGHPARLRSLSASFRRPVWPGDTLRTEGFHVEPGVVALRTTVSGQPEPVLAGAWAELCDASAGPSAPGDLRSR